jgi:hypothetical protein
MGNRGLDRLRMLELANGDTGPAPLVVPLDDAAGPVPLVVPLDDAAADHKRVDWSLSAERSAGLNASMSFLIHCVYVQRLSYKATRAGSGAHVRLTR